MLLWYQILDTVRQCDIFVLHQALAKRKKLQKKPISGVKRAFVHAGTWLLKYPFGLKSSWASCGVSIVKNHCRTNDFDGTPLYNPQIQLQVVHQSQFSDRHWVGHRGLCSCLVIESVIINILQIMNILKMNWNKKNSIVQYTKCSSNHRLSQHAVPNRPVSHTHHMGMISQKARRYSYSWLRKFGVRLLES